MSAYFEFPAPVLRRETGMTFHFIPVPPEIAEQLFESDTKRVVARVNGKTGEYR